MAEHSTANLTELKQTPEQSTANSTEPPQTSTFAREWRRRVLNFTPSWFSVNMGTGIVSLLLYNLPYQFNGLHIIAVIVFLLNCVLFVTFLIISILRYTIWPSVFWKMLYHPQQSLFLGTLPMGFATIVNMVALVGVPNFGSRFATLAWILWWIDAVLAIIIAIGMPFVMFTHHKHEVANVNGVWLLPSVSTIVASASGAIVAEYLSPAHAKLTVTICYILLGTGFLPAFLIMGLYFQRLAVYKIPASALIVSTFLPLGPCGQGAFSMLRLSSVVRKIAFEEPASTYSTEDLRMMGNAIYGVTIPIAFVVWGFGLFWLVIAISSVSNLARQEKIGFNMGWWGFTFPLGVFATATTQFATELNSGAFRILGMIFSLAVVLLWMYVGSMTLIQAWTGVIFVAPCLGSAEANLLPKKGGCQMEETPQFPETRSCTR